MTTLYVELEIKTAFYYQIGQVDGVRHLEVPHNLYVSEWVTLYNFI